MQAAERESMWRSRIEAWQRSGLSGPKFCAREGLYIKSFYTWRKRLGATMGRQASRTRRRRSDLVPVRVVERGAAVRIEIGAAAIVVTVESSPAVLRTVLTAFGVA